jgi:ADP-ribose pyrophosphatase YjhB (NUDIX family)
MPYVPPHLRNKEPMGLARENRYKAVIVPRKGNEFIVVRNRAYGNLTFPVGGCKKSESVNACARRELSEETRRTVQARNMRKLNSFTSPRSNEELKKNKLEQKNVTMHYIIFLTNVGTNSNIKNIREKFLNKSLIRNLSGKELQSHMETSNINSKTLNQIVNNKTLWSLMRSEVVPKLKKSLGP